MNLAFGDSLSKTDSVSCYISSIFSQNETIGLLHIWLGRPNVPAPGVEMTGGDLNSSY